LLRRISDRRSPSKAKLLVAVLSISLILVLGVLPGLSTESSPTEEIGDNFELSGEMDIYPTYDFTGVAGIGEDLGEDVVGQTSGHSSEKVSESEIGGYLCENIRYEVGSKSENELVTVVIRLGRRGFDNFESSLYGPKGITSDKSASQLKSFSRYAQSEILDFLEEGRGEVLNTFWLANAVLAEVEVGGLDDLVDFSNVRRVHANFEIEAQGSEISSQEKVFNFDGTSLSTPDVTWGLERIGAPEVWETGFDGTGVRVAVSDSGVDIDHPDLEGKMVTDDPDDPHYPGGWIEFDEVGDVVEGSTPRDETGHGTHVSGTILGGDESGTHIGVAPGANLMHALVLPDGEGTFAQVVAGMEWKVDPYDRYGDSAGRPADVANMSWGLEGYESEMEEPLLNMVNAGVVPVASIGNEGEGTVKSPGAIYEAFAVGASDWDDGVPDFSSGDVVYDGREDTPGEFVKPDFSAPGTGIKSAAPGGGWESRSGTSSAASHVSGAIALLVDARPDITVGGIRHAFGEFADYHEAGDSIAGEEKNTRYGYGIINADESLQLEFLNLRVEPDEVYVGNEVALKIDVRNNGETTLKHTVEFSVDGTKVGEDTVEIEGGGTETAEVIYTAKNLGVRKAEAGGFVTFFEVLDRPTAETGDASDVRSEEATLNGKLTGMGMESEVSVYFEFREVGGEWNSTPKRTLFEEGHFSETLDGLKYGTTYHYRAAVRSDDVTLKGSEAAFTTDNWGSVETLESVDVGAEEILLQADVELNISEVELWFRWREKGDSEWNETRPGTIFESGIEDEFLGGLRYGTDYEFEAVVETYLNSYGGGSIFAVTKNWGSLAPGSLSDLKTDSALLKGGLRELNIGSVKGSFRYREEEGHWEETDHLELKESGSFESLVSLNPDTDYEFLTLVETYRDNYTNESIYFSTPSFRTSHVENVTTGSAVMVGELEALGSYGSAEVGFRYKEEGDNEWIETDSRIATEPEFFRSEVSGLTPYTDYVFMSFVEWNTEEEGNEVTFTTETFADVETLHAEDVTYNSAKLVGELSRLDADNATVWFEWRRAGDNHYKATEGRVLTGEGNFEETVTDLSWNTEYVFRARVSDVYEVDYGIERRFSTKLPWVWILTGLVLVIAAAIGVVFIKIKVR